MVRLRAIPLPVSDVTVRIFQPRVPSVKKTKVPGIFPQLSQAESRGGIIFPQTKQGTLGPGLSTQRDLGGRRRASRGACSLGRAAPSSFYPFLGVGAFGSKSFFRNWFSREASPGSAAFCGVLSSHTSWAVTHLPPRTWLKEHQRSRGNVRLLLKAGRQADICLPSCSVCRPSRCFLRVCQAARASRAALG